mmetsp:Transcript_37615/g.102015  ORF Transcript_37615/g.102015 Transcript_37615/m.102015 type:complete len:724 (+) Transcript_37615:184-2355(+)
MIIANEGDAKGQAEEVAPLMPSLVWLFAPNKEAAATAAPGAALGTVEEKEEKKEAVKAPRRASKMGGSSLPPGAGAGRRTSRFAAGAGKPATPRDKLESLLGEESGFSAEAARRNGMRGAIKLLFPKRMALEHAILAAEAEAEAAADGATEGDANASASAREEEIVKANQALRTKFEELAFPKSAIGVPASGTMLVAMLKDYAAKLEGGPAACAGTASDKAMEVLAVAAEAEALLAWESAMVKEQLPLESASLMGQVDELLAAEPLVALDPVTRASLDIGGGGGAGEGGEDEAKFHGSFGSLPMETSDLEKAMNRCLSAAEGRFVEMAPKGDVELIEAKLVPRMQAVHDLNLALSKTVSVTIATQLLGTLTVKAGASADEDAEDEAAADGGAEGGEGGGGVAASQRLLRQARRCEAIATDLSHDLTGFMRKFGATARGPSKWEAAVEVIARDLPAKLVAPGGQAADALAQLRVGVRQSLKEESAGLEAATEDLAQLDTARMVARQRATEAVGEQIQVAVVEKENVLAEVSRLGGEVHETMLKGERLERKRKVELRRHADTLATKTKEIGLTHRQLEDNHGTVNELLNSSATAMSQHQSTLDRSQIDSVIREKDLVQAYVNSLQENLDNVQSNLEKKQRQVHEVEFQWAEARNKATESHDQNESTCGERDQLEDLVLKLKLYMLGGPAAVKAGKPNPSKNLPSALLRELDHSEAQAIEEIFSHA